jgi:predicted NBD/HSP70 family sugar kinase
MAQLRVSGKALPTHNRQHNRSLILQHLFHDGMMSRADLARSTGLTPVTVSDLVNELRSEALLLDLGRRADTRIGKPATLIALDENSHHVVSLNLSGEDEMTGAITNMRGEILHRRAVPLDGATGDGAVAKAVGLTAELLAEAEVRILGIGVGTPGVVDREGVVREAPNLGWSDLDLVASFGEHFDVPVHVSNDANAAALAVHTFRDGGGSNLMLVMFGDGVGAGLIIGGSLVEGDQFTAGEIGHVVIDEEGEPCTCGRRGCLEVAISVSHLAPRLAAAVEGERDRILGEAGRALGGALSPIIAVLGVDTVILAGPEDFVAGALLAEARTTIERRTLESVTRDLRMSAAVDSDDLVLQGATALVLTAELGIS